MVCEYGRTMVYISKWFTFVFMQWDSLFISVFGSSEFSWFSLLNRSHGFKAMSHNVDFCIPGYAEGCCGNREPSVVV